MSLQTQIFIFHTQNLFQSLKMLSLFWRENIVTFFLFSFKLRKIDCFWYQKLILKLADEMKNEFYPVDQQQLIKLLRIQFAMSDPFLRDSFINFPQKNQLPQNSFTSLRLINTDRNFKSNSQTLLIETPQKSKIEEENQLQEGSLAQRLHNGEDLDAVSGKKKKLGCTCKKTQCLKMYCECFFRQRECTSECRCCSCKNDGHNEDKVAQARLVIRKKNSKKQTKFCTCKKSSCQKKYCECYNQGKPCNESCKCIDCANQSTDSPHSHNHDNPEQEVSIVMHESHNHNEQEHAAQQQIEQQISKMPLLKVSYDSLSKFYS